MTLSAHRKQKIYIAATMGYGIGSGNPEEMVYYNQIKEEMNEDRKKRNMGVIRKD